MNPIIEKDKSIFVKCKYNERGEFFEGYLQRDIVSSCEREVAIAGVSFQPKTLENEKPIEIGLSLGEGGNALLRIEKGMKN